MLLSIIAGYLFLDETHPDFLSQEVTTGAAENTNTYDVPNEQIHHEEPEEFTPLYHVATAGSLSHPGADLTAQSYGTFNNVEMHEDEDWYLSPEGKAVPPPDGGKAFTKRVTMLIVALGIFTYHSMTYDHLLPIFLQDGKNGSNVDGLVSSFPLDIPGGLGISTQTVGIIMAFNGIIALAIQAVIFPLATEWIGVWNVFVVVTILHPIAYFIVPFLAYIPSNFIFTAIYACLTVRNLLSILAYPVLLILIKQASPSSSVLGKINGLAASAGAAARTVAPPVAGYLYTVGSRIGFTGVAWWASTVVAMFGAAQLWFMTSKKHATISITGRTPCFSRPAEARPDVIHVHVEEDEGAERPETWRQDA